MHQIDMGLSKRYNESEVIGTVVKATSLGLSLRHMLEIKKLPPPSPAENIKGHFNVKFQLKPYLDVLQITNDVLIERMNKAASAEYERQVKLKKNSTKVTKVNEKETEVAIPQKNSGIGGTHTEVPEAQSQVVKSRVCKLTASNQKETELFEVVKLKKEMRKAFYSQKEPSTYSKWKMKR